MYAPPLTATSDVRRFVSSSRARLRFAALGAGHRDCVNGSSRNAAWRRDRDGAGGHAGARGRASWCTDAHYARRLHPSRSGWWSPRDVPRVGACAVGCAPSRIAGGKLARIGESAKWSGAYARFARGRLGSRSSRRLDPHVTPPLCCPSGTAGARARAPSARAGGGIRGN